MDALAALQRWIYSAIGGELNAFAADRDWLALAAVLPLGIAFGAIHALTPGHGKTVLASYLAGSPLAIGRGLATAATLALTHVASAVVLALLAAPLISRSLVGAGRAPLLEDVSRGLLAAVGAWLVFQAIRGTRRHSPNEGWLVGLFAGLIPCPLTLFVMLYALGRGIAEAGVTFAAAMMLGVSATLAIVATVATLARERLVKTLAARGASLDRWARGLSAATGIIFVGLGLRELLT